MITQVNNFLERILGIRIIKSKRIKKFNNNKNINIPLYIEFVGVPGVGKTFLLNQMLKINKKKLILKRDFIRETNKFINDKMLDNLTSYQLLADMKLKNIFDSKYLPTDKLKFLRYFDSVIIQDALIVLFNKNYTIISDEGLFHNFSKEIEQLYNLDELLFKELIEKRAFIFCYAEAEIITQRVIKRYKEKNTILPQYKFENEKDLNNVIKKSLEFNQQFFNLIKNFLPVISINTTDNILENAKRVKQFIDKLQQKNFNN